MGIEVENFEAHSTISAPFFFLCTESVECASKPMVLIGLRQNPLKSLLSLLINPSLFASNCVAQILKKLNGCILLPQIIHTCSQPIYLITEDVDLAEQLQPPVKDPS